jgi:hypothetical protein
MEQDREEKIETQEESARSGARAIGRAGAQRGQAARQSGERAQGRVGQKPQEDAGRPAQCATAPARTSQVNAAMAKVRARFGDFAIGLGYGGLRYIASERSGRSAG